MTVLSHILGFPRIGIHRELKKAQENYWSGNINQSSLLNIGKELRYRHWDQQKNSGIDLIPVGDFSWYDHVLNTSLMLGNVPYRHRNKNKNYDNFTIDIDTLFRIARGNAPTGHSTSASEMTKWFNTNYHYIVPEFHYGHKFFFGWNQLLDEVDEALILGHSIKPILLGPITYLWLGKVKGKNFNKLTLLADILPIYQKILKKLKERGIKWVQIDEPILVLELTEEWRNSYFDTYLQLKGYVNILLTTYFDDIFHQLDIIETLPIQGIHIDLVSGNNNIDYLDQKLPKNILLSFGIINGRNIWRTNLYHWFNKLYPFLEKRKFWIGSSCSLLHCPIDLNSEIQLNDEIKNWFSFSLQKCKELFFLQEALNYPNDDKYQLILKDHSAPIINRIHTNWICNPIVRNRLNNIIPSDKKRNVPYNIRSKYQKSRLRLPILPTTTIGSFPQTSEIRKLRRKFKQGSLNKENYNFKIKKYIKQAINEQNKLGLDVLVHGEFERNDMVEYFSEYLDGLISTKNGWVQSYGSRCVKPPIIIGDISRSRAMTLEWTCYAQSLTDKPVKGILTGPVTILSWSFPREDISRKIIAQQIALALRDEVKDLEKAGIGIIQIDEPALREGLPLKISHWKEYLNWAVDSFRLSSSVVKKDTQIHTHMCYGKFRDIILSIKDMDVDVITIETFRSKMDLLKIFKEFNFSNEIGPGVYDIHSPNIPTIKSIVTLLQKASKYISRDNLWVNPDCGLKTRSWLETSKSISNMVNAAKKLRNNK